jgi:hypothetical protein
LANDLSPADVDKRVLATAMDDNEIVVDALQYPYTDLLCYMDVNLRIHPDSRAEDIGCLRVIPRIQ